MIIILLVEAIAAPYLCYSLYSPLGHTSSYIFFGFGEMLIMVAWLYISAGKTFQSIRSPLKLYIQKTTTMFIYPKKRATNMLVAMPMFSHAICAGSFYGPHKDHDLRTYFIFLGGE